MLLSLLAVAALGACATARASTGDEQALAKRYAPVVRLVEQKEECGPGEPYQPIDVNALFGQPTVALRGPWNGADLVKIGPTARDLTGGLYDYHLDFPGDALSPGCGYEQLGPPHLRGARADGVRPRRDRARRTRAGSPCSTGSSTSTTTGTTCTKATGR